MDWEERSYNATKKISLTPMIDMVFLLLVFFMLTTTFNRNDGVELNFSETANDVTVTGKQRLISVKALTDAFVEFDGERLSINPFKERLLEAVKDYPEHQVLLQADDAATVQDFMRALDVIRQMGVENVTVIEKELSE